ncbi:hypothetical protein M406DRAFT_74352 [Cryphonectria parasitica EP155]|uniref:SET domain-containing protein n=1 Tax=Cryphonectria parasitica (strain ATCC 38755 / EP155) TaxID=660469 RepID=A0A9P4XV45_CRYP1|nr:uncharacterized protein M406DRAFT_74352 [Cryphonectria parasitica EP155]KAF3761397.1 hypothetical protein M406DRAFT_74352 [Cryphonectria parasitica EP155]
MASVDNDHPANPGGPPLHTPAPHESLIELRPAGHMGWGTFATRKILKGTRIIEEAPVFTFSSSPKPHVPGEVDVPREADPDYDDSSQGTEGDDAHRITKRIMRFCRDLLAQGLMTGKMRDMESLPHNLGVYENQNLRDVIRRFFVEKINPNLRGGHLEGEVLEYNVLRFAKLYAIWMLCLFRPDPTLYPGVDDGMYPVQARINHSCAPNAWRDYNTNIKRLTVHALCDIQAGEQIFIPYGEILRRTKEERCDELWLHDGIFECVCRLCQDQGTDELQMELYAQYWGAFFYLFPDMHDPAHNEREIRLATNAAEALEMTKNAIQILKHPLIDAESKILAESYRMCCFLHDRLGDINSAIRYSALETQLQLIMRGTDHPDFLRADQRFIGLQRIRADRERV